MTVADMQTILVLDKDAAAAGKALSDDATIAVAVTSVAQFRHYTEQSACDVWLCDLSMEGLAFQKDAARVQSRNPRVRVLLTGPASVTAAANALIQQGEAVAFVPKPWRLLPLRQAVLRGAAAPAETGKPLRAAGKHPPVHPPARDSDTAASGAAAEHPGQRRPPGTATPRQAQDMNSPRYRLDDLLGEGGVGQVWRARDLLLDTVVAVKVLRADFVRDQTVLNALKHEARICMQLSHPHVVRVFDFSQRNGTFFLVMEYIRGQTLHALMQQTSLLQPSIACTVTAAVASALDYAHKHGVLHNDLTPGNVMITEDGVPKLIDFGIATVVRQRSVKTDFVFGTPAYMSPEQLRGDAVIGPTTDVFALGVLIFQMLTGNLPQSEDATTDDLALRPRAPVGGIPAAVATVVDRALAFDPAQRWPSAGQLAAALKIALGTEHTP